MKMNIPLALTLARILLIPVMVGFYLVGGLLFHVVAAGIFGIAAITDWLDGYLARKLKLETAMGAFLDPVADKLIVCVALVLLASDITLVPFIHLPVVFIVAIIAIIMREIVISALREWMAGKGVRSKVAVSPLGKYKTTLQMISILLLLSQLHPWLIWLGEYLLYVSAVLTILSMVTYLKSAWVFLQD